MNKKLISIAIAAAVAAPMAASADTTLYGRINNSAVMTDQTIKASAEWDVTVHGAGSLSGKASADEWDVEDYSSRLGVKGSEDLGNGMKAIYQIELQMETSDGGSTSRPVDGFGTRLGYVGLAGGFGTLAVGRQWTPYYGSVDKTDVFQIAGTNQAYMGLYRVGDAIAYKTPNMGGFSGALALVVSDGTLDTNDDNIDHWNLSLDYNNGPLSVGASYFASEGDVDSDLWGIGGKYNFGMFSIIGQYEDGDVTAASVVSGLEEGASDAGVDLGDAGDDLIDFLGDAVEGGYLDGDAWAIAGQAKFGNNTLTVKYGERNSDGSGSIEGIPPHSLDGSVSADSELEEWIIQLEHHFSKRTRIFAVYDATETTLKLKGALDDDLGTASAKITSDTDRFGIGIRHDF